MRSPWLTCRRTSTVCWSWCATSSKLSCERNVRSGFKISSSNTKTRRSCRGGPTVIEKISTSCLPNTDVLGTKETISTRCKESPTIGLGWLMIVCASALLTMSCCQAYATTGYGYVRRRRTTEGNTQLSPVYFRDIRNRRLRAEEIEGEDCKSCCHWTLHCVTQRQ